MVDFKGAFTPSLNARYGIKIERNLVLSIHPPARLMGQLACKAKFVCTYTSSRTYDCTLRSVWRAVACRLCFILTLSEALY